MPGISLNLEQRPTEDEAGDDVESDSEMSVYGRNVFMGYLNREKDIKVRLILLYAGAYLEYS